VANPEARTNAALKRLGEEYRLGMIPAAEYRAKRRQVFESWAEREATTSPGITQRNVKPSAGTVPPAEPAAGRRGLVIGAGAVALVLVAGAAWLLLGGRKAPPGAAPTEAVAPVPEAVQAVADAAGQLVASKRWDAAQVEGFLGRWRALSPDERKAAWSEPAVRSLRDELQQSILALEAVAPAAGSDDQAQLQRLVDFARELDQDAS